jgi:phosphoribulokinase
MATQTFTAPLAAAQVVRATGAARPNALKQVKMAQFKPASIFGSAVSSKAMKATRSRAARAVVAGAAPGDKVVVIGLAADSGCGKSTFMRRVTGIFGGDSKPPQGGNPDSNTLLSDMTTVICLDDYHSLDRNGRKVAKVTALAPESQNFDLMYEQVSPPRDRPPPHISRLAAAAPGRRPRVAPPN